MASPSESLSLSDCEFDGVVETVEEIEQLFVILTKRKFVVIVASFAVGDRFSTFQVLLDKISDYVNTNFIQLWKREARNKEAH